MKTDAGFSWDWMPGVFAGLVIALDIDVESENHSEGDTLNSSWPCVKEFNPLTDM